MEFKHVSVLFDETINGLNIKHGGIYVDGTLGGGGHSSGILEYDDSVRLIGIDRDAEAVSAASKRLERFSDRITIVNRNFSEILSVLEELKIGAIDGAVLDLGVSSYQLDNKDRGFSYMQDAPLDMRMDKRCTKSAYTVVNEYSKQQLTKIFYEYGEENWSKRIAEFIEQRRAEKPIETTGELVDIIKAAIPKKARMDGGHPAKRVFQAIRIEVNGELEILKQSVKDFVSVLKPGGRLCIITFHSLEDRIVKNAYNELSTGCVCPKEFPVCVCGKKPIGKAVTRKPILPSRREEEENSRSKSAKLRIFEKFSE